MGFHVPAGWKPNPSAIESTLPYPWSALYVQQFRQPFNADSFLYNMAALANLYRKSRDYAAIRPYVDYLVDRLKKYRSLTATRRWLPYKFAYSFHDRELKPGSVCAYWNASAMTGVRPASRSAGNEIFQRTAAL
ncbi:hypothetical protein [Paraburkholderia sp. GAS334]|uniref:hypothetical protein n=1 Tax=Paraburkholderia sp. GAS334 TaxID=3035131 RepID=UPI003D1B0B96